MRQIEDAKKLKNECVAWIRDWFEHNGKGCKAVVGISGGKDSTVVAHLCAEALGPKNVIGVLMPDGCQADIEDAKRAAKSAKIKTLTINIEEAKCSIQNSIVKQGIELTEQSKLNLSPRLRMSTLYAVAQAVNGRVVGTGNYCERQLGYFTLWGDGVADLNPIGMLTVSEVIAIGEELGIWKDLLIKPPADGLTGKTDEEILGFTYADVEKRFSGETVDPDVRLKIVERIHHAHWKKDMARVPMYYPSYESEFEERI